MTEQQNAAFLRLHERVKKNPHASHVSIHVVDLYEIIKFMADLKDDHACMEWLEQGGNIGWTYKNGVRSHAHAGTPSTDGCCGETVRAAIKGAMTQTKR